MAKCPIACVLAMLLAFAALLCAAPAAAKGPLIMRSGAPFGPPIPRPALPVTSCSYDAPVCVHGELADAEQVVRTKQLAARSWLILVEQLGLSPPLFDDEDPDHQGRLHLYLQDGRAPYTIGHGHLTLVHDRDAAPAFVLLDRRTLSAGGCMEEATIARAVFRAAAQGVDIAEAPTLLDGMGAALVQHFVPCPAIEVPLVEERRAHPGDALTTSAAGGYRLARELDVWRGGDTGLLIPASLGLATQASGLVIPTADEDLGPAHFHDSTSLLDVLDATLQVRGSSLADEMLNQATRAATGPNPAVTEWQVKASTLPRRLGVRSAVAATGATYVRVDLDVRPKEETIEVDLVWEMRAQMRWRVVKLNAANASVGEVTPGVLDRGDKQTIEVRHLEGAAALVVIGINAGDPDRPFRPNDPPFNPHGYEIAIYAGPP